MDKPKSCLWCGKPLPKRRRKYCSDECAYEYSIHNIKPLWWQCARAVALERADYKCEKCERAGRLEVHHIEPLARFEDRWNSPKNRQDNLMVLCCACHEDAHRKLPKKGQKGMIPKEQTVMELSC